jgi:hypothetical protein
MKGAEPVTLYLCPLHGAPPRIKGRSMLDMALKARRGVGFSLEGLTEGDLLAGMALDKRFSLIGSGYMLLMEWSRAARAGRKGTLRGKPLFFRFF